MAKTAKVTQKRQTKTKKNERDWVKHSVQRLYNKSAPMLIVESILFLVTGILMLVNPVGILTAMTFVFGCVLILIGFYRTVSGFVVSHEYGGGWMDVLFGLINVIIGVLFLVYPLGSVISLVYAFIILFVFQSVRTLVFAINMVRAHFGHYIFNLIMAIVFVALSIALLFYPLAGAVAAVIYLAIILMAYAVADLYMYWQLRKLKRNVIG